jgi:hypothetical protein
MRKPFLFQMCHPVLPQLDRSLLFVRRGNVARLRIVGKDRCAATEGHVGWCASHRPSTSSCDSDCIHVLRASAKLPNAPNSFVMSVRPSVWNNSAPTGQKFYI